MLMRSREGHAISGSNNLLLRRLSRFDRDLLDPHTEPMTLSRGDILVSPGEPVAALIFPNSGILSVEERIGRRRHIEIAVIGHEGMIGWPALLGCERSTHAAVVQGEAGSALRIDLAPIREACLASPTLWGSLLCFVNLVIQQMGHTIAAHLDRSLDQSLARWLLMRHDRVGGDELLMRHEEIADALGVRRASITDKMHVLEGERLIRCNRGRLLIRDRAGLESVAGEAYGAAEAHYRRLIAPFGKTVALS